MIHLFPQKHPEVEPRLFTSHAVMVTNIPQDSMENKLMNVTFKNMFPSINPNTVSIDKTDLDLELCVELPKTL